MSMKYACRRVLRVLSLAGLYLLIAVAVVGALSVGVIAGDGIPLDQLPTLPGGTNWPRKRR